MKAEGQCYCTLTDGGTNEMCLRCLIVSLLSSTVEPSRRKYQDMRRRVRMRLRVVNKGTMYKGERTSLSRYEPIVE